MSGIGGLFCRDGRPVDRRELQCLHDALGHRGPDGGRLWIDGRVGLSHQLLRTTSDAGEEEQPLVDVTSGLAITFDGRLDNCSDLISVLGSSSVAVSSERDAALVLRAYERWGNACASRLLGDFAFAIWDGRARRLFCARDVMGIRPFCYAVVGSSFVFGSELSQLLASGRVNGDPDEEMVAEYLANQIKSHEGTLYRQVRRLPAAHWMTIDADRITISRFWRLDPSRELRYGDDREYADHFRSLFKDVVACRLKSDRPRVGAYVSGGLDSSSVVGMARMLAANGPAPQLETFSMVFPDDPQADERAYIADVVRTSGFSSHVLPGRLPDADRFFEQAERNRDVPDLPAEHLVADLRALIRKVGIRVVLTGAGGDNGFSGSLYHYADLLRRFRLLDAWRQFRADARISDVGWSPFTIITSGVLPLLPRPFKNAVRPLARRLGWPGGPPRWIRADFAARVGLEDRLRAAPPATSSFGDRWVCEAFENGWSALMLEMSERTAAAVGVEERHPFFDRRMMEFALAIPEAQRWQDTRTKLVLRNAMGDLLPPTVRARTDKADFSAQVVRAIETLGGASLLDRLEIASLGWVDQPHISWMYRDMMQRFRAGDGSYTDHMFPLWMVASIELWLKANRSVRAPATAATAALRLA